MRPSRDRARHDAEQRFQAALATVARQQRDLDLRDYVRRLLAQVSDLHHGLWPNAP